MLQAEFVPNQQAIVAYVTKGIKDLEVTAVKSLILYGRRQGADFPDWTERVELQQAPAASFQTVAHAEQSIDTPSGPLEATASPHKKVAVLPAISATSSLKHQKPELKWYETANSSLIIALLVLFFPLGLWCMWKYGQWSFKTKGMITGAIVLLLLISGRSEHAPSAVSSSTPPMAASASPAKTAEIREILDTPAGSLPVVKYEGESCLYANATTAQTDYYGMEALKDQLKARYHVTCVLWN